MDDDKIEDFAQHVYAEYQSKTGIDTQIFPVVAADGASVLDLDH